MCEGRTTWDLHSRDFLSFSLVNTVFTEQFLGNEMDYLPRVLKLSWYWNWTFGRFLRWNELYVFEVHVTVFLIYRNLTSQAYTISNCSCLKLILSIETVMLIEWWLSTVQKTIRGGAGMVGFIGVGSGSGWPPSTGPPPQNPRARTCSNVFTV